MLERLHKKPVQPCADFSRLVEGQGDEGVFQINIGGPQHRPSSPSREKNIIKAGALEGSKNRSGFVARFFVRRKKKRCLSYRVAVHETSRLWGLVLFF